MRENDFNKQDIIRNSEELGPELSYAQYLEGDSPDWYFKGEYVLDEIFGMDKCAMAIMVCPEGNPSPEVETVKFTVHEAKSEQSFFPPVDVRYNVDYYLLTEKGIAVPQGYPPKPSQLALVDEIGLSIEDVVRGISYLRYPIEARDDVRLEWQNKLAEVSLADLFFEIEAWLPGQGSLELMRLVEEVSGRKFRLEDAYGSTEEIISRAEFELGSHDLDWDSIESKRMLDVGSGKSYIALANYLRKGSADIISIDINPPLAAWSLLPEDVRQECITADAAKMPFQDSTFDVVFSNAAVDLSRSTEARRVLKPEGKLVY